MKILIISHEFDTLEEAAEFLRTHGERTPQVEAIPTTDTPPAGRKPRSDAGKPRGPYSKAKSKQAAPAAAPAAEERLPEAAAAPVEASEPAATPEAITPAPESAPAAAAPLTIADLKAEMTKLARKHGIEANMALLAEFGVQQVSLLPKEKYAEFVAAVKAATAS
jgi:hypothetical protein